MEHWRRCLRWPAYRPSQALLVADSEKRRNNTGYVSHPQAAAA